MKNLSTKYLKAVVFDWDNTLAASKLPLEFAVDKVLSAYHLPPWNVVKQKRDNNLSFRDNFVHIFGSKAAQAYEDYRQIYLKTVANNIKAYPFTRCVLQFFKKRYIPIMLMTNKDRLLLEYELPILYEPEYFDHIVCGHEAERDKPHGEHLIYTIKNCLPQKDISPQSVWVIGDSPQDSKCAACCGALAIRIGKSLWHEDEQHYDTALFFDSFVDFYQSLLLSN